MVGVRGRQLKGRIAKVDARDNFTDPRCDGGVYGEVGGGNAKLSEVAVVLLVHNS